MSERPSGFGAVMNQRLTTDPASLDYFPTPPWAARAGGEVIKRLDPTAASCWEPACGEGHMAHGLRDYFAPVHASDIHAYGGGDVIDFLDPGLDHLVDDGFAPAGVDWVVTNPPFNLGEAFVRRGLEHARRGVAMLLRLNFLEGQTRYRLLYGDNPVTVVAPFAERVPMTKGRWDPGASTATAYAWFIWIKGVESSRCPTARLGSLLEGACPRLEPIAPGAKARLSRPSDLKFARAEGDAPLFGGGA